MAIKFLNKTNANDISVVQNRLAVGGDFTPEDLLHIRGYSNQNMGIEDQPTIRIEDDDFGDISKVQISNFKGNAEFFAPISHSFYVENEFTSAVLTVVKNSAGVTRQGSGSVGVLTSSPRAALDVGGGIRIANDSDTPDGDKAGTMRYREIVVRGEVSRSRLEMCMRTGNQPGNVSLGVYEWVIIKENEW